MSDYFSIYSSKIQAVEKAKNLEFQDISEEQIMKTNKKNKNNLSNKLRDDSNKILKVRKINSKKDSTAICTEEVDNIFLFLLFVFIICSEKS